MVTGIGILSNTMITPNIPDILSDLGRGQGGAGFVVAAGSLPAVALAPVIGVLADRHGRKRILLPCLVLFAVGALAGAIAPNFEALIATRLLQGAGGAGLINLALVLIGDHWEGRDRTRLIGRNSSVLTLALAVLPSVSGFIAEVSSWRASIAVGGLGLPVAVAGWFLLPDTVPGATRSIGRQLRDAVAATRNPILLFTFVAGFLLFVVIFGVFLTTLPVHLEEQFNLGPAGRGLVLSVSAIGATVVSFNLGAIRTVVPLRILLWASCALIAVAAFGIALAPILALVLLAMVLYGFGDGAIIPAMQDVVSSVPAPEQRASVLAAWVVAVRLGQTAGPLGAAALFAAYSTATAMMAGAAIFVGVGLMFRLGPVDDAALASAAQPSPRSA